MMDLSDIDKKWLAERIRTIQDLERLIAEVGGEWEIEDFREIPMGWSTVVRKRGVKISIWSHRCEIEVEELIDDQWRTSESLNRGWDLKDSDSHVVLKVLGNAVAE